MSTDLIAIIVLMFTIYLVKRNTLLTATKTFQFRVAAYLALLVTSLEIASNYFGSIQETAFRIPNLLTNSLGFALAPVIPLAIAFLYDESLGKHKYFLFSPIIVGSVFSLLSPFYGWIFIVSDNNVYSRGPLFSINVVVSLYSFIIMIYSNKKSSKDFDKDQRTFLSLLYLLIISGNIVQIIFKDVIVIWICVALSILLYYIFLRELQFKYDLMTGVRNRFSFEKKIVEMQSLDVVTIIVLDLNNLKNVNDSLGHLEGDKALTDAAYIIKTSFDACGITYRIGGDEFCVLCNSFDKTKLENAFNVIRNLCAKHGPVAGFPFTIAYGYEVYNKLKKVSIFNTFAKADLAMYTNKAIMKG